MKIDQDTFNSVVKANMEDLELSIDEAIETTIEELKIQGYELTGIDQSEQAVCFDKSVVEEFTSKLKQMNSFTEINEAFASIRDSSVFSLYMNGFIELELYDTVIEKMDKDPSVATIISFLQFSKPFYINGMKYGCKHYLFDMIINGLKSKDATYFKESLQTLESLLSVNAFARCLYSEQHVDLIIIQLLQTCTEEETNSLVNCLLSLIKEDKGIDIPSQSRTLRIKQLTQIECIFDVLISLYSKYEKNESIQVNVNRLMSKLIITETICTKVAKLELISFLQKQWIIFFNSEQIISSSLDVFSALAQSDKLKNTIFSFISSSLSSLSKQYESNRLVILSTIQLLGTVSLRNKDVIEALVNQYNYQLVCLRVMKLYPRDRKMQIYCVFLLRNLIDVCHDCETKLVEEGLIDHLNRIINMDKDVHIAVVQLRRTIKSVDFKLYSYLF